MLDDVAAHRKTETVRAIRRALLVLKSEPGPETGQAYILAQPYVALLKELPDAEAFERRLQGMTGIIPAAAVVLAGIPPTLLEECKGLLGELGLLDVFDRLIGTQILLHQVTKPSPERQDALMEDGLRALGVDVIDRPEDMAGAPDDAPEYDDEPDGDADDRRRMSQALGEVAARFGIKLLPGQAATALDFWLERVRELEEEAGLVIEDWPETDHAEGAERARFVLSAADIGELVLREAYEALTVVVDPPPGDTPEDQYRAVARAVAHQVERTLMARRKRLPELEGSFMEGGTRLADALWARVTAAGALELSLDGQRGIGLEAHELGLLRNFLDQHDRAAVTGAAAAAASAPEQDDDVRIV